MDRTPLPTFVWVARPLEIPPALLELDPESDVRISNGKGGTGTMLAGDYIKELRETIARQADGFYTTQEASHILAEAVPGMNAIGWQRKFNEAWRSGELVVRDMTRLDKSMTEANLSYMDLVKESDLDAWLEKRGCGYLFPSGKPIAPPAPEVTDQIEAVESARAGTAKRRTWRDAAWPYMVTVFESGQYATAKDFYRALETKAGVDSPFENGTGSNRGSLFVRETRGTLTLKTVQNTVWPLLKQG